MCHWKEILGNLWDDFTRTKTWQCVQCKVHSWSGHSWSGYKLSNVCDISLCSTRHPCWGGGHALLPLPHCSTIIYCCLSLSALLSHPLLHGVHIEMRVCSQGMRVDHTPLTGSRHLELRRGERRRKGRWRRNKKRSRKRRRINVAANLVVVVAHGTEWQHHMKIQVEELNWYTQNGFMLGPLHVFFCLTYMYQTCQQCNSPMAIGQTGRPNDVLENLHHVCSNDSHDMWLYTCRINTRTVQGTTVLLAWPDCRQVFWARFTCNGLVWSEGRGNAP